MSDNPQLVIEIALDDGTVKKGIAKLPEHFEPAGKKSGEKYAEGIIGAFSKKTDEIKKILTHPAVLALEGLYVVKETMEKVVETFKEGINEASQEFDAMNELNFSLAQNGNFSKAASESLSNFATSLQKTTRFSDDAVLSGMALLETLGGLKEQGLKRATIAATDMASALHMDLISAMTLVGKAAQGEISTFSRYGLKIKEGSTNAETFANTLQMIEQRMGGRATADVNTYSGSITLLSNSYKNLLGELGNFIVKSPLVVAFSKEMTRVLNSASDSIGAKSSNLSIGKELANGFLAAGKVVSYTILGPLEVVYNFVRMISSALMTAGQAVNFVGTRIVADFARILPDFIVSKEMKNKLFETSEGFKNSTVQMFKEGGDAAADLFTNPITTKVNESIDRMKASVAEMQATTIEPANQPAPVKDESVDTGTTIKIAMLELLTKKAKEAEKEMLDFTKNVNNAFKNQLANGIAGGVQNIVNSLMTGQNVFQNFGKFVLSTMGDMAVSLGQMFILKGLAIDAIKGLAGGVAVAVGISLVALGQIMKTWSGSGTSSASTASSASSSSTATPAYSSADGTTSATTTSTATTKEEEKTAVTVNVHGSVYDSNETGMRIVDLINEAIGKNGAKVYA